MVRLNITWVKSSIGHNEAQRKTIRALGLRRLNQSVTKNDGASIRGMINKVRHLVKVKVEEENGEAG